ncbi:MAG: tetratricopeptide repeat protein [Deltaproteobacteria bacterium]|nr:tetratricopeptide repeat protein [Deltaproteobacteria bacterium]
MSKFYCKSLQKKSKTDSEPGLIFFLLIFIYCISFVAPVQAGKKLKKLKKQINNWEKQVLVQHCELKCMNGLGTYYLSQGKTDKTIRVFRKITRDNPLEPMGWYYLGYALRKQKKWKQAIKAFSTYESLKPKDPEVHYSLGKCYYKTGNYREASTELKKYLHSLSPQDKVWIKKTEKLLLEIENKSKKNQTNKVAITTLNTPKPRFFYQQALKLFLNGYKIKAMNKLTAGIKQYPHSYFLHKALAALSNDTGLCYLSLPWLLKGNRYFKNSSELVLALANCFEKKKKHQKAASFFEKYFELKPNQIQYIYKIAQMYSLGGQSDLAITNYRIFLKKAAMGKYAQLKNKSKAALKNLQDIPTENIKFKHDLPQIYSCLEKYKFKQAEKLIKQNLTSTSGKDKIILKALWANLKLKQLQYKQAEKLLEPCQNKIKPPICYRVSGLLKLKLRQKKKALVYFKLFLDIAGKDKYEKKFKSQISKLVQNISD